MSFRPLQVDGHTLYVPEAIDWHPQRFWSVTNCVPKRFVRVAQGMTAENALKLAWAVFCDNLVSDTSEYANTPERLKKTFPVRTGVNASFEDPKRNPALKITVSHSFQGKNVAHIHVGRRLLRDIDQNWLDEHLKTAIGMRRTFEFERDRRTLTRPLTLDDRREDLTPKRLRMTQRITVHQLVSAFNQQYPDLATLNQQELLAAAEAWEREYARKERPIVRRMGKEALERLLPIALGEYAQSRVVARFLLCLYNGTLYPFDLTELRRLDRAIHEDCVTVLQMDYQPEKDIEAYIREGDAVFQELANRLFSAAGKRS